MYTSYFLGEWWSQQLLAYWKLAGRCNERRGLVLLRWRLQSYLHHRCFGSGNPRDRRRWRRSGSPAQNRWIFAPPRKRCAEPLPNEDKHLRKSIRLHLIRLLCSSRPSSHSALSAAIISPSLKAMQVGVIDAITKDKGTCRNDGSWFQSRLDSTLWSIDPRLNGRRGNVENRVCRWAIPFRRHRYEKRDEASGRRIGENVLSVDEISWTKRVVSARSRRRAHCCVAAGLLTGATVLSVQLGTIRASSPPSGGSLKHSPTTFHTPYRRAMITTGYSPCSTSGEQTNVRKRREKLERRIYYSFVIWRISGERLKPIAGYLDSKSCVPVIFALLSRPINLEDER